MGDQPRADTYEFEGFFADGRVERPLVEGTVARGELDAGARPEVDLELVELGRARFYGMCAACHGRDGYGEGVVVQRGFPAPPPLHEARLRGVDDGHLYRVIADGQGKMPSHAAQLDVRERWAVVAFVRALQLSQHAEVSELPPEVRERLTREGVGP